MTVEEGFEGEAGGWVSVVLPGHYPTLYRLDLSNGAGDSSTT